MELNFIAPATSSQTLDLTNILTVPIKKLKKSELKKYEAEERKKQKLIQKEFEKNETNKYKKYGKIYKIYSDQGPKIYIGSCSEKYISNRMGNHRGHYYKYKNNVPYAGYCSSYDLFDEYGIDNCKIMLIENFKCDSKKDLLAREGYHILQNKGICVNRIIAGRDRKTYFKDVNYFSQKKYYEKNKDKINEYIRNKNKNNDDN